MQPDDIAVLRRRLSEHAEPLAMALIPDRPLSGRSKHELRFGNHGSFRVYVGGPKAGRWTDFESGDSGDLFDLIRLSRRCSFGEALRFARDWVPVAAPEARFSPVIKRPTQAPADTSDTAAIGLRLWREAVEAHGSVVERYLAGRGLTIPDDAELRYHPACPRGQQERLPAMLALLRDIQSNEPCGVHRTFLRADGTGKADGQSKMMLGRAAGAVVKLTPDADVATGLGLVEGIENGLTLLAAGWLPIWVAGSAGAISTFPVLDGIEALTVFADRDDAGLKAALGCVARWQEAGREAVARPPKAEGLDWNDVWRSVSK